jgi:hypothetical protein
METKTTVRFGEEVDVRFCMCGREKYVIIYGKFDKCRTGSDKFKILAAEL